MTSPDPDALHAANRRGVIAMALGMASSVANDALVKYVSQSLPATELIFLRGLFATALVAAICAGAGVLRQWRTLLDRKVAARAAFDAFATMTYLISLFHLPIANATAINMATPLVITLLAVLLLKEQVGLSRWLAIVVGFTGVLLVVQPRSDAFNAYALLCLFGTLLHSSRDLITRSIHHGVPSLLITLSTAVAVTLLSGVMGFAQEWQPPTSTHLGLLGAASVFLSGGYYLLTISMRSGGEMSLITPFRYTGLLFAIVLGFAIWGDVPNAAAWAGIALLVGAGLYMLRGR